MNWQAAYREAVLETDQTAQAHKIDSAIDVLRSSLREIDSLPEHFSERQRISDALTTLDMIKKTELEFPPPPCG